jgi:hypothetical protein
MFASSFRAAMTTETNGKFELISVGCFALKSNPEMMMTIKQKYGLDPTNRNKSMLY